MAAHGASGLCTIGATLFAWWWFRRIYARDVALALGLALAVNWAWARTGSAILSEPLYELLSQVTILICLPTASRDGIGRALPLGILLAACLLTRQIAIGLILAILVELCLQRRWRTALIAGSATLVLVTPWLAWLQIVGDEGRTQANLLIVGGAGFWARIVFQSLFYVQRIPDQITGPLVEFATVIRRSAGTMAAANVWAGVASGIILAGWIVALRWSQCRLAGLIPLFSFALLLLWPYTEAGRFLVPLIPCLLIGAVEGASGLLRETGRYASLKLPRQRLRFFVALLLLVASLPYSGYSVVTSRSHRRDVASRDFDSACAWLLNHGDRPGPILARHPGEVYLATGRHALEVSASERPGERDASPDEIGSIIRRYNVAYLLIDADRYLRAPVSPLSRFVAARPDRVRLVWSGAAEESGVAIYEVFPGG
jgi:hypothetical protein